MISDYCQIVPFYATKFILTQRHFSAEIHFLTRKINFDHKNTLFYFFSVTEPLIGRLIQQCVVNCAADRLSNRRMIMKDTVNGRCEIVVGLFKVSFKIIAWSD